MLVIKDILGQLDSAFFGFAEDRQAPAMRHAPTLAPFFPRLRRYAQISGDGQDLGFHGCDLRDESSLLTSAEWDVPSFARTGSLLVMSFDSETAFNQAYCRRVKDLRRAKGWTQQQMATALGLPLDRYKKYEDRSPMPPYLVERFALVVGRSIAYVMTGKPTRQDPDPIGGNPPLKRNQFKPNDR